MIRPNPVRRDPTQTGWIRKKFLAEFKRRLGRIKREVTKLLVEDDIFGLKNPKPTLNEKLASTQFNISDEAVKDRIRKIQRSLDPSDVLELEEDPHITIRCGLHDLDPARVRLIAAQHRMLSVDLGRLSLFQNEEQDVLKVEVSSPELHSLNAHLGILPNTETYKEFRPHLTIAYLKPGRGSAYVGTSGLEGTKLLFKSLVYSDPERRHTPLTLNAPIWEFLTSEEQLNAFTDWLQTVIDGTVFEKTQGLIGTDFWFSAYIEETFRQGMSRAFEYINKQSGQELNFYEWSKKEFLRSSFGRPVSQERVRLLAARTLNELKGVTDDMAKQMKRTLVDGFVKGDSPWTIAREINRQVDGIGRKRAEVIARTEVIRAHNEGQLEAIEAMGLEEVGVQVEWITSGLGVTKRKNPSPCPVCAPLANVVISVEKAHGLLPRHPNCMCSFVPAGVGESGENQKKSEDDVRKAIQASLAREGKGSRWAGRRLVGNRREYRPNPLIANACGAGVKGKPGFQKGNTCAKGGKMWTPSLSEHVDEYGKVSKAGWAAAAAHYAVPLNSKTSWKQFKQFQELPTLEEQLQWLESKATQILDKKKAKQIQAHIASHQETLDKFGVKPEHLTPEGKLTGEGWNTISKGYGGLASKTSWKEIDEFNALPDLGSQLTWFEKKKAAVDAAKAAKKAGKQGFKPSSAKEPTTKPPPAVGATPKPSELKVTSTLPGSTSPSLAVDATGKKWVLKDKGAAGHIKNEVLTDKLYDAAGIAVPKSELHEQKGGVAKVSEFIEGGITLGELKSGSYTKEFMDEIYDELGKGFVVDALLANHDVIGLNYDNILIKNGKPIRIDNGGGLLYRAQGALKSNFGSEVTELKTMRDPNINPSAAAVFGKLTDDQIHDQIRDVLSKKEAILQAIPDAPLRGTIEARMGYLAALLPPGKAPVATAAHRRAEYAITAETAARVKAARINGRPIAGDAGDIEDMDILAWGETGPNSKPVTKMSLKLTQEGSSKVMAKLGLATTGVGDSDDTYEAVLNAAKTVNYHAGKDSTPNVSKMEKLAQVKGKLASDMNSSDPAVAAKAKYYHQLAVDIEAAAAGKKNAPMVSKWKDTESAESNKLKASLKKAEFAQSEITNGFANRTEKMNPLPGTEYSFEAEGVRVSYVPGFGQGSADQFSKALRGKVELTIDDDVSNESLQKGLNALKSLGIDTTPNPAHEEAVYIHRSIYLRNDHNKESYQKIWSDPSLTPEQKVPLMKKWVKDNYSIDLPNEPNEWYQPQGQTLSSFGNGHRYWNRWDIPPDKMKKEMAGYALTHETSGPLSTVIDGMLNSGGEATATLHRIRKGIPISAGMSPVADLGSGGASYFFTRIKKKQDIKYEMITFKIDRLARADAVTYEWDNYGSVSGFQNRVSTVDKYKGAATKSGNETIFKHGLSILDDVDTIYTKSADERKKIIDVFKKHKVTKLPDGRSVEEVVEVR